MASKLKAKIRTFNFDIDNKESVLHVREEEEEEKTSRSIESIKTKSHTMNTRQQMKRKNQVVLVKAMNWHKFMKRRDESECISMRRYLHSPMVMLIR